MILFLIVFCLLIALGFGVAAAVSDLRGLLIPNAYSAGIVLAFIPAYIVFLIFAKDSGFFEGWGSHLGAFAIVFAVSFLLFSFNMFGAGDSKLATAYALWAGMGGLSAFIFYMALVGGLLGVVTLLLRKHKPFKNAKDGTWIARAQAGENAVPYGVAISAGALASFVWLGYFTPDNLQLLTGNVAPY